MDLEAGESVIFSGHPSWRSLLWFYLRGLFLAAVIGLVAYLIDGGATAGLIGSLVFVVVLLVGFVRQIATTYTITDRRLHIRRGIVSRHVQETKLDRVQNVNSHQTVVQRVLRIGTVDFDTAGSDDFDFTFAGVASPDDVVRAVGAAQRAAGDPNPL